MGVFDYIKGEWGVLKAAPLAFVFLLSGGFGGGWYTAHTMRDQEVKNLEGLVRLKEGELGEYRAYDERLKKVEDQLSAQQLSALKQELATQPSSVEIGSSPQGGNNSVVKQLTDAFTDSGWDVKKGLQEWQEKNAGVILSAPDKISAQVVEKALTDAGVSFQRGSSYDYFVEFSEPVAPVPPLPNPSYDQAPSTTVP